MTEYQEVFLKRGGKLNETDLANIGTMILMTSFYSLKLNLGDPNAKMPIFKMESK